MGELLKPDKEGPPCCDGYLKSIVLSMAEILKTMHVAEAQVAFELVIREKGKYHWVLNNSELEIFFKN